MWKKGNINTQQLADIFPVLSIAPCSAHSTGDERCHQPFVFWKWNWKHKSRWASGRTFSWGDRYWCWRTVFMFYMLHVCATLVVMVMWGYGINSFSLRFLARNSRRHKNEWVGKCLKTRCKNIFTWKFLSYLFNKKNGSSRHLMKEPLYAGCGRNFNRDKEKVFVTKSCLVD